MADGAIDLTTLSDEQQLALQQFTSVTDQHLSAAIPLLQKCQWNAQIAITRFFDGDAETVDPAAEAARTPPPPDSRRSETLMDSISARGSTPTARRGGGLEEAPRVVATPDAHVTRPLPFPFSIILLPFNLTYAIFQRLFGAVGYLFPFIPRLLARFWSGRTSRPSRDTGRKPLNPRDAAARFMREFEEEYGVTHSTLPFHEGGYAEAFDIAKRDLRYLLIVLLSPEHDDTTPFVRDTLLSPDFLQFVKQSSKDIILWAGTVQDAEAYQVSVALNATSFPFVSLICHTPSVSSTAMSKIAISSGIIAPSDLITKLQTAIHTQSQELERIKRQRQEQQATRNLRQEQESAYERSLAQDREKARKKREEAAAQEKAEQEELARAERKADEARILQIWRKWRASNIHPEPADDVKDAVRISVRMSDGERVVRRFEADADLEELYAFVECYDILNDADGELSEKQPSEPEGYEHEYKFRLVSPMPREAYDVVKGGSIRNRIGRSGNLIVERIVGEQDDDDDDDNDGNS